MSDISKNTLQKIKKDKVRPHSKQYFLLRRSAIWTCFGFSIFFGSIASGVAIFLLRHIEWDLYQHLGRSFIEFVVLVFPYFWLIFLVGFTCFTYYSFRRTEQGYRYHTLWIISQSIVFSIIGGGFLYVTGLPEKLEAVFQDNVPFYRGLEEHRRKVWMSPRQGLLAGSIVKVISEQKIQIEDLHGGMWVIDIGDAIWRGRLRPSDNLKIKIIGEMKGRTEFIADEIRPWEGRGYRGNIGRSKFKAKREK